MKQIMQIFPLNYLKKTKTAIIYILMKILMILYHKMCQILTFAVEDFHVNHSLLLD